MSFTSGPWRYDYAIVKDQIVVSSESHGAIARLEVRQSRVPLSEVEPNARLIAAAPELLEACRVIGEFHSDIFCGLPLTIDGKPIDHTKLNQANELAHRAIAKVEGRS